MPTASPPPKTPPPSKGSLILWLLALCLNLGFLGIGVGAYLEARQFQEEGVFTEAQVIFTQLTYGSRGTREYQVVYLFVVDTDAGFKTYQGSDRVSEELAEEAEKSGKFEIIYLASNPEKSQAVVNSGMRWVYTGFIIFGISFVAFSWVVLRAMIEIYKKPG